MKSGRSPRTRIAPLRLGIEYQDAVALRLLVDWLGNRQRYSRVKFEDADGSGFLDDARAEKPDGTVELRQIKYGVEPDSKDDEWSWAWLLKTERRQQGSRLARWESSFRQVAVTAAKVVVEIITNSRADPDLTACLRGGKVDFGLIHDQAVRDEITRQLGSETAAREFFSNCCFFFTEPALDEAYEGARRRFELLGGTHDGWQNLVEEVRRWHIHKADTERPDGYVTLQTLLRVAHWNRLRPLSQEVEVPTDFQLPAEAFHKDLLAELSTKPEPCTVIVGTPGVGKSTYTSHLFAELRKCGVPAIRHHYHLSFVKSDVGRLDHRAAAESLLHDLRETCSEALGRLAEQNPKPEMLRDYLVQVGEFYAEQGKMLIVVVDGLDHVWRDRNSVEELRRLFDLLLPVVPGVALLVASQPVEDEKLPNSLLLAAPRQRWRRLPNLHRTAIKNWLKHHWLDVQPPGNDEMDAFNLERATEALHDRSDGHPLHLRYTIEALKAQAQPATPENITALPGCVHADIENYYAELWRALGSPAKLIAQLLTACPFPWPATGIHSVLRREGVSLPELQLAQRSLEHLLAQTGQGLQPFHRSLALWIEDQPEAMAVAIRLKQAAVDWLKAEASDGLRWAHLWPLQADLGDPLPLVEGLTRAWVVDAIAKHYSWQTTNALLQQGARVALQMGCYERAVAIGLLAEYFDYYTDNNFGLEQLLPAQLAAPLDPALVARLGSDPVTLRDTELVCLAEHAQSQKDQWTVGACFQIIRRRFNEALELGQDRRHNAPIADPTHTFQVAVLVEQKEPLERVLSLLQRNIRHPQAPAWIRAIVRQCRRCHLTGRAKDILRFLTTVSSVPTAVIDVALSEGFLLSLEEGADFSGEFEAPPFKESPEAVLHEFVLKRRTSSLPLPLAPSVAQFRGPMEFPERRGQCQQVCIAAFRFFLANHLLEQPQRNRRWLDEFPPRDWLPAFLEALNAAAAEVAEGLRGGRVPASDWIYSQVASMRGPRQMDPRAMEMSDFAVAASDALVDLTIELLCYRRALGLPSQIILNEMRSIAGSSFWFSGRWLSELGGQPHAWLSDDALTWLAEREGREMESKVEEFSCRADIIRSLAIVCGRHGNAVLTQQFITSAADNFLTHGSHKDVLLSRALGAVREIAESNPTSAAQTQLMRDWLLRLALPIEHVGDFTDGDGTHHLPGELASVIIRGASELFLPYYRHLCATESYADATDAFRAFIEQADLSDPINLALARTVLDRRTLQAIDLRAAAGHEGAAKVKAALQRELGAGAFDDLADDYSASNSHGSPVQDAPPTPELFPPSKLGEYLKLARTSGDLEGSLLDQWLAHWRPSASPQDLFESLRSIAESDGHYFRHWNELYELARRHLGASEAFSWLVKAQVKDHGWQVGWTSADRARWRFEQVRTHYPGQWKQFLRQSLLSTWEEFSRGGVIGHGAWPRLVEFLIVVRQLERACSLVEQMVSSALEMVSPQRFTPPAWIQKNRKL